MNKKFTCIVCDPPYSFSDKLRQSDVARGSESNYNTMTIDKIKSLSVKEIAAEDGAILALWVPSSLLQEGLDIMNAWGFKHKQTYIWVKSKKQKSLLKKSNKDSSFNLNDTLSFGMGRIFRNCHEIALIGINNNNIYKKLANKSQRTVSFAENLKHSKKPEDLQNSIDLMFPDSKKIEIFSRRKREGWTCIGNESPETLNEDIFDSIKKLI